MGKVKQIIDSIELEELSSREELIAMMMADDKEMDKDQEGLWIVGWQVA